MAIEIYQDYDVPKWAVRGGKPVETVARELKQLGFVSGTELTEMEGTQDTNRLRIQYSSQRDLNRALARPQDEDTRAFHNHLGSIGQRYRIHRDSIEQLFSDFTPPEKDVFLRDVPPHIVSDLHITKRFLNRVMTFAKRNRGAGRKADYIPELAEFPYNEDIAIAAADLHGNIQTVCTSQEALDAEATGQSVMKTALMAVARYAGIPLDKLALGEAAARKFNDDPAGDRDNDLKIAMHYLNNAGGIVSAHYIMKHLEYEGINGFDAFRKMMCKITGRDLQVNQAVYQSEKETWAGNNRLVQSLLVKGGLFESDREAIEALDCYTLACSLNMSMMDMVRLATVFANDGKTAEGERIFNSEIDNDVVAAMGEFGFYDNQGRMRVFMVGGEDLIGKSGVGGYIIFVIPGVGVIVTRDHYLDPSGNGTAGKVAGMILHRVFKWDDRKKAMPSVDLQQIRFETHVHAMSVITMKEHELELERLLEDDFQGDSMDGGFLAEVARRNSLIRKERYIQERRVAARNAVTAHMKNL